MAALRLNRAMNQRAGFESNLLVQEKLVNEPNVFGLDETYLQKKMAFARFVGERLAFLPYEKDKSVRFAFSPARFGADVSQHPLLQNADLIHLHWTQFGYLSLSSLKKIFDLQKPVFCTLHDQWTFTGGCHYSGGCERYEAACGQCKFLKRPSEGDLSARIFEQKRRLFANLAPSALTLVSPSAWLGNMAQKAELTKKFGLHVVPNPIDTSVFVPIDKRAARQKLGLPTDKKLVLFGSANTTDPRKGFAYFEAAIAALGPEMADVEVVLFGKTGPILHLKTPVRTLGLLTEAQIMYAYAAADVMVVPSLEDNFPNTVAESMACGTPVVGFETGGVPEQIAHLQDGYVAQLKDTNDLKRGIEWVLTNPNYEQMRQRGVQKIGATMRNQVVAQTLGDCYLKATELQP